MGLGFAIHRSRSSSSKWLINAATPWSLSLVGKALDVGVLGARKGSALSVNIVKATVLVLEPDDVGRESYVSPRCDNRA